MSKCIKCGSYAFNLYKEGIDQGGLCDVHYWQGRAHSAEALAEQPAPVQQEPVGYFGVNDYGRWEENKNEQGQPFYTSPQPAPMSQPNRVISYAAASKLRELGYEWVDDAWTHLDELAEQPAHDQRPFCHHDGRNIVGKEFAHHSDVFPLYTAPSAQHKPLTDEEITKHFQENVDTGSLLSFSDGVRFAEAAHGIKGGA